MPTITRADLLDAPAAEVSRHLAAKGLASTIREEREGYEIECPGASDAAAITAALSDYEPTTTREAYEAEVTEARRRGLDADRWRGMRDELDGLRQYHGLSSPTNAQSVAAIKAIIRVLRVMIRD